MTDILVPLDGGAFDHPRPALLSEGTFQVVFSWPSGAFQMADLSMMTLPVRRVRVTHSGPTLPDWVSPTVSRIRQLMALSMGWDGYDAKPVSDKAVQHAIDLLGRLMLPTTQPPAVVPTTSGGVQLEWHTHPVDIEIEVEPTGNVTVIVDDHVAGTELEGHLFEMQGDLERAIQALSS